MVIKFINLRECIGKFADIKNINLAPVIIRSTRIVQRRAKGIVPVDTGSLRNSIKTLYLPRSQTGVVYTSLEYAPYVEFGTRYQAEQPFMIPALELNRDVINEGFKKYLKDQIAKKTK